MLCLPKDIVNKFKNAIAGGKISPEKLTEMTSEERRRFLADIVGEDQAKEVNALFESKLLLKDQQRGIITWAKTVARLKPEAMRDLLSRVNKMDRVLNPTEESAFLKDLAGKKFNTDITYDEAQKISQLAKKADDLKDKGAKMSGVSDEYLKARNDLSGYVESLKPQSEYASIGKNLEVIARNNLLLNPSTPIKTTIGQLENTALDAATRRIATLSLKGENPDIAAKANSEAWETFKKTGNNTASMENLDDRHVLGKGETFGVKGGQAGEGFVGKTARVVGKVAQASNKVAIQWEHNVSFTKFYQKSFFDSTNIFSSELAKQEGLTGDALKARAADIMKDAVRIDPQTSEGEMIRLASQRQAARITSTNETWLSTLALRTKDAFNEAIPGSGDLLMPIAKIPANIIANGLDNAGVGLPKGIIDVWKGREAMSSSDIQTRMEGAIQFREGIQRLGRIAGTTAVAALIASRFQKSDFRTDNYGNHFFKLGNFWINTEYLSIISPALAGFMAAREKGTNFASDLYEYGAGVGSALASVPAITGLGTDIIAQGLKKYGTQFLQSRLTPRILTSLFSTSPLFKTFFGSGVETTEQYKADQKAKAQKAAEARAKKSAGKFSGQ